VKIKNNINWDSYWNGQRDTERCGLVFGYFIDDGISIEVAVEVPNIHKKPSDHFSISVSAMQAAQQLKTIQDMGVALLGPVHTHRGPHGGVSYPDIVGLRNFAFPLGMMLHLKTKTIYYYNGSGFLKKERLDEPSTVR
jgi:proteasome lid subunit RPN8/RPN11